MRCLTDFTTGQNQAQNPANKKLRINRRLNLDLSYSLRIMKNWKDPKVKSSRTTSDKIKPNKNLKNGPTPRRKHTIWLSNQFVSIFMVFNWMETDFKGAHVKSERSKIFKYYFEFDSPLHNFTKTSFRIYANVQHMKNFKFFTKSKMSKLLPCHWMATIRSRKSCLKRG